MSDVQGTGISLILGAQLRKIFGHGGIAITHSLNQQNVSDPDNFQLKVSGAELQSSIATLSSTVAGVQQQLTALNLSGFVAEHWPCELHGEPVRGVADDHPRALDAIPFGPDGHRRHEHPELRQLGRTTLREQCISRRS